MKRYLPVVWFVLGFGIFVFTRMSKLVPTIPAAILVASVFILRFSRSQPARRGNLLTLLGFLLSVNIGLVGLFDLGDGFSSLLFNLVRSSLIAVLYFLPYGLERALFARFEKRGWSSGLATLTFPVITTGVFFLSSLEGPFEGAIQTGKFVFGPIVGQQLLSVLGVCGFIFVVSWFASVLNYMWENRFAWRRSGKTAMAFLAVAVAILSFGVIKVALRGSDRDTVKIAAVIVLPDEGEPVSMDQVWREERVSNFERRIAKIEDLASKASLSDARIVSFSEYAMVIGEEDVQRVRGEYERIAKDNDVYLSITYAYYGRDGKGDNRHLLIDNYGTILLDYTKRYLVGFGDIGETGVYRKGPEIVQYADTPYGRVAVSICRDMEIPHYMRQAGRANVDIMLSAAFEWPKGLVVSSVYMRAIENGFSLVRPAFNGITIAEDYNGRILARMDSAEPGDCIAYADIPTQGVRTLYPRIGDVLGWICIAGLVVLLALTIILRIDEAKKRRAG